MYLSRGTAWKRNSSYHRGKAGRTKALTSGTGVPEVQKRGGTCLARLSSRSVAGPERKPSLLAEEGLVHFPVQLPSLSPCSKFPGTGVFSKVKSTTVIVQSSQSPHGFSGTGAGDGIWAPGGCGMWPLAGQHSTAKYCLVLGPVPWTSWLCPPQASCNSHLSAWTVGSQNPAAAE